MTQTPSPGGPRSAPQPAATVVVVGSANADLLVSVGRRPGAGETVLGGELRTLPGGKGANQAVAAARLGARTAFVGRVGADPHGDLLLGSLRDAGVDTSAVTVCDSPTGVAIVTVTPDGDNSIVVAPGANARVTAEDTRIPAVARATVLLLQREIDSLASLAAAEQSTGIVVLNLAPSGPVPAELLVRTDVLVVNQHEAAELAGLTGRQADGGRDGIDPAVIATRLRDLGPEAVVITLGGDGAVAVDGSGQYRVAAPAVEVVDTTGAGDAFTGALAWRLAEGDDLPAALATASRVGALTVTRPGAQPSFPTAGELEAVRSA
jgi:ribokinase